MKILRFLLLLILMSIPLLPVSAWSASGGTPPPPVRVQSVQANFIQEKHLKILAHPIFSSGRFVFRAPESLRWEYTKPFRSILILNDGRVRKFIEHNGQITEDHSMRFDAMQVALSEINGWLEGRFTENAAFTTARQGEQTILLTPKQESVRAFICSIVLQLGDTPGLLDTVTIYEGPDSFTRLVFADALLNQPVQESLFTGP